MEFRYIQTDEDYERFTIWLAEHTVRNEVGLIEAHDLVDIDEFTQIANELYSCNYDGLREIEILVVNAMGEQRSFIL